MNAAEKPELKPANDNPWYWLATLYGEMSNDSGQDKDIAQKNRIAWNRWFAKALGPEQHNELLKKGVSLEDLVPLNPTDEEELAIAFTARSGRTNQSLPAPTEVVDFSQTIFDRDVVMFGFIFPDKSNFKSAVFSRIANFESAVFSGSGYFQLAVFSGIPNFQSATFSGTAYFQSATFSGIANFQSTKFSEIANFQSATFSGGANFQSTMFSGNVSFESATFFGGASFESATFSEGAYFQSTFSRNAIFESAMFSGIAYFASATFSGQTYFKSATFSGRTEFESATFADLIDFINSEFTAKTSFALAHFKSEVPDFRGAKLHEATEWHEVRWPPAPLDKRSAQNQVYAYERLKQEMERLKKHEDEQRFFCKELRARRELVSFWTAAWFFNYLYEALSDYCQSTSKPLLWLCGLFLLVSAVFAWVPDITGTSMTIPQAASLSFASIFAIFPIPKGIMASDVFATLSSTAQIIVVVESFFGTLLLFLLGVALRNRFRMR